MYIHIYIYMYPSSLRIRVSAKSCAVHSVPSGTGTCVTSRMSTSSPVLLESSGDGSEHTESRSDLEVDQDSGWPEWWISAAWLLWDVSDGSRALVLDPDGLGGRPGSGGSGRRRAWPSASGGTTCGRASDSGASGVCRDRLRSSAGSSGLWCELRRLCSSSPLWANMMLTFLWWASASSLSFSCGRKHGGGE